MQSAKCRRGLSYLEVLIASGIALTGILALLALFPVAILNLQKGQVTDVISASGPSALRTAQAVGVTEFANWLAYVPATQNWTASGFLTNQPSPPTGLPGQNGMWHSVCFDPRFAAEGSPSIGNASFSPWLFPFTPSLNVNDVRMARVTLRAAPGTTNFSPMGIAQARSVFKVPDDLIFERPTDDIAPAFQLPIERDGDMMAVRRNYMADYEYVITMTPSLRGIPVGFLPNDPTPYNYILGGANLVEPLPMDMPTEYTMSAVVFYKRQVALDKYVPGDRDEPDAERVADVINFWNVDSAGQAVNGGDITIQARSTAIGNELEVHQGDYVLLSGNMYSPLPVRKFMGPLFQWYRVASVNGDSYPPGAPQFRDLTLDGPDWPASLMPGFAAPFTGVQITIVSGVVGVFTTQVQVQ